jgi:SAM-dependent methyltransferase
VLGVDTHPFATHVARRASERGLGDRVAFAIGDGGRLPVRDAAFDLAICVGAPSIIGTERCLGAMHRALRPGGAVAVSDWVWAKKPIPPAAIPDGYDIEPLTSTSIGGDARPGSRSLADRFAVPPGRYMRPGQTVAIFARAPATRRSPSRTNCASTAASRRSTGGTLRLSGAGAWRARTTTYRLRTTG